MPDFQKKNRILLKFITHNILKLNSFYQMVINANVDENDNDPEENINVIINNN